jgi:hypothetical protein
MAGGPLTGIGMGDPHRYRNGGPLTGIGMGDPHRYRNGGPLTGIGIASFPDSLWGRGMPQRESGNEGSIGMGDPSQIQEWGTEWGTPHRYRNGGPGTPPGADPKGGP